MQRQSNENSQHEASKTTSEYRPPELVILDFDGTLADTWTWFRDQLAALAEQIGYRRMSSAEIEGLRGRDSEAVLEQLGVTADKLPALAAHITRQAERDSGSFRLFDGVAALIEELAAAGVPLAIVSSNTERVVHDALGTRLYDLFSTGRFGAAVFDKASAFRDVVAERKCDASATFAVGDETRDLEAAAAAGVRGIAVEWGFADANLLRSTAPGATAADADALKAMLLGDNRRDPDRRRTNSPRSEAGRG